MKQIGEQAGTVIGQEELKQLTDETAAALIAAADEGTTAWVKCGRILKDYAERLQPNGKFSKPDPYDILAGHPEVPYAASHLRSLVAASELYEEFGGDGKAPRLGITHFTLVLGTALVRHDKERFLRAAIENEWTTRELKAAIETETKGNGKAKPKPQGSPDFPSAWNVLDAPLARLNADLMELRSRRPEGAIPVETIETLRTLAGTINDILAAYGREGGAQ